MTNTTQPKPTDVPARRVERSARLRWVPIDRMRVSPLAQRDLKPARVDKIVANFDPEQLGALTVNERDGGFYIIDGQHRAEALRKVGWGDQQIQCWTYVGLTEAEEAEKFLKLNDTLAVYAFAKFRVGLAAGRMVETDIDRIVRAQGLKVSMDYGDEGNVAAVGTLRRVYDRAGPAILAQTLRIIRDAYGGRGLESRTIDGIAMLCQRYDGELKEAAAVAKLSAAHGGVNGLLGKAENLRRQTGNPRSHCIAAAAVELINTGVPRASKLPTWWKKTA